MPKAATHLTVLQGVSPLRRDYNSPRFRLLRESPREATAFSADSEPIHSLRSSPEKTPIRNATFLDRTRSRMYGARRHVAHDSIALKPDDIGATVSFLFTDCQAQLVPPPPPALAQQESSLIQTL